MRNMGMSEQHNDTSHYQQTLYGLSFFWVEQVGFASG
jgi:hypothetical protein